VLINPTGTYNIRSVPVGICNKSAELKKREEALRIQYRLLFAF
jgi:hypothetical protein